MTETVDIVPGLLDSIQKDFSQQLRESKKIQRLEKKLADGEATYMEANQYALEISDILTGSMTKHLLSVDLPDGRMYYNIAQRLLEPVLKNNHRLISNYSVSVQKALNGKCRLGIKAVKPKLNTDRIDGFVNKVADAENFEDVQWMLKSPIANYGQSVVDDTIDANAQLHAELGLKPQIVRTAEPNCCTRCTELEGTYEYSESMDREVFQRHENCRCLVEYYPGDGRIQDAHTKSWR